MFTHLFSKETAECRWLRYRRMNPCSHPLFSAANERIRDLRYLISGINPWQAWYEASRCAYRTDTDGQLHLAPVKVDAHNVDIWCGVVVMALSHSILLVNELHTDHVSGPAEL